MSATDMQFHEVMALREAAKTYNVPLPQYVLDAEKRVEDLMRLRLGPPRQVVDLPA